MQLSIVLPDAMLYYPREGKCSDNNQVSSSKYILKKPLGDTFVMVLKDQNQNSCCSNKLFKQSMSTVLINFFLSNMDRIRLYGFK